MPDGIEVRVENQLVRFVCPEPVGHQEMIEQLDAQPSGNVVIKALENPRATIIVDEEGRIIVHGVHRVEAATAAAKEVIAFGKRRYWSYFRTWSRYSIIRFPSTI